MEGGGGGRERKKEKKERDEEEGEESPSSHLGQHAVTKWRQIGRADQQVASDWTAGQVRGHRVGGGVSNLQVT